MNDGATAMPPVQVLQALGEQLVRRGESAWARLDMPAGSVAESAGLERFGYPDARSLADFVFLHGVVPEPGEPLLLPMIAAAGSQPADVFVHHVPGSLWLVFLCAGTRQSGHAAEQQRLNEAVLAGRAHGRLLERFVGTELVRHRLHEAPLPTAMAPETRRLTMLFADIRGFTPFCEAREAAEACRVLNRYLERMVEAVAAHGGIVDKIIGDAVMALFGLTDGGEDAAERAIGAARDMIAAVDALGGAGAGVHGIGVGIATGEVAVGVLGTAARRAFTVVGHRVNLAARLESSAEPGEILVDDATRDAAGAAADGFMPTRRSLKGLPAPVAVYACPVPGRV